MLVLGLDLSSTKVGIAVVDGAKHVLLSQFLKLPEVSLEDKALFFKENLVEILKKYNVGKILMESPLISFKGKANNLATIATLQRFNGMCSLVVREVFGQSVILVNASSARKAAGVVMEKGKEKTMLERKRPIIERVSKLYEDTLTPFEYGLTYKGNPEPGTDDRADAILIALYGVLP